MVDTTVPTRTRTRIITTEIETETQTSNSGGTRRIIDRMDSTEAISDTTIGTGIGTGKGTPTGDRDTTRGLQSTTGDQWEMAGT